MIVDVHTHPPTQRKPVSADKMKVNAMWRPDRPVQVTTSWDDYFLAQQPADVSIVFDIYWHPTGIGIYGGMGYEAQPWASGNINDNVAAFVAAHPKQLIGFMALHPHDPGCLDELERCRTDLNLKGIKLGPNYQNFDPLEARAMQIYEQAQRYGLPIMFHQGTSPQRNAPIRLAHPLLMDEVAIRFPDLKIIMAHVGHPYQTDTIAVIRKHPNVYADMSANIYRPYSFWEQMVKAHEWNVLDKILFGTDFPVTTVQESIDALRNINRIVEGTALPRVPLDKIEAIIQRNALALLGID